MKTVEKIAVDGSLIDFFIHIEPRKGIRASITKKGVQIRIPTFLSPRDREEHIEKLKKWAIEKILEQPRCSCAGLQHGKILRLGDNPYKLHLDTDLKRSYILGNNIFIKTNEKDTPKSIETKLLKLISPLFEAWLLDIVPKINKSTINKPIKSIEVKNVHSKWGSCSQRGELVFSSKLFMQPMACIYYVIVHELCHRIEMNHSPRYWALVSKFFPKYKEAKKMLKESMI